MDCGLRRNRKDRHETQYQPKTLPEDKPPPKTNCTLVLHRKRFDKGTVVLGGCNAPGCAAMYVVVVKKAR